MLTPQKESGVTPQATARNLVDLVHSLAQSAEPMSAAERTRVLNHLDLELQAPRLGYHVIEAILEHAVTSSSPAGAAIAKHRDDKVWARPYPLAVQEYSPVFKHGPVLTLGLIGALQQSAWPRTELQALRRAVDGGNADVAQVARVLANDFNTVAQEAGEILTRLTSVKQLKARCSMHVVQIEAYLAATLIEGSLAGHNCIDLGSGGGELLDFLQKEGAQACGTEADLPGPGLFGIAEEPRFDVVFATGLMEPGAFSWPGIGLSVMEYNERGDEMVTAAAKLLKPNGLLVVRNVNYPIPFTGRAIAAAGLSYQRVLMPFCTPTFGGRLRVWRKL